MNLHLIPRLYISFELIAGQSITLEEDQTHYIVRVMRLGIGDKVRLFNGRHGEWLGSIAVISKKSVNIALQEPLRPQGEDKGLLLVCAPLKKAHFEYAIEKATELGVTAIQPILTARTQIREVNMDRCHSIAIEAAEQSERLSLPVIHKPLSLKAYVDQWPPDYTPIICAEWGEAIPVRDAFTTIPKLQKIGVCIGPEGGFTSEEFALFRTLPSACFVSLGPRILRADTAALAALSCWQAIGGDWALIRADVNSPS